MKIKTITKKISNNYWDKTDKNSLRKLFIMGFDILQIHLITGANIKSVMESITYNDVIKRVEKADYDCNEFETIENVLGIEFDINQ